MPFDILIDEDGDLLFKDGDLVIGESTRQHQKLLLLIEKGELRQFPTHCVGVRTWINDDVNFADLKLEIKREFERDGMTVSKITLNSQVVQTEASYD